MSSLCVCVVENMKLLNKLEIANTEKLNIQYEKILQDSNTKVCACCTF